MIFNLLQVQGGVFEIYAHRLANGLARLGHQVTVLHSPSAYAMLSRQGPTGSYTDHPNVTVHGIHTPLAPLGLLAVQQSGRPCFQGPALRRWLHSGTFDVIHYNNVSLLGGPHVFRYGQGLKLCTLIEHWLVCPLHVLWKFNREVCTKPSCLRCTLISRRPPQWWRYTGLMQRATQAIDAFIGPSLFTMQMHRERGIHGTMIQLPLFHSEPHIASEALPPINNGRPFFLFVGRLVKIKGVQTIIPLFRALRDVDLLIAGEGDYEQELRLMAADAPNIYFVGRLDQSQLYALYQAALATIVPSLCYETFGLVVIESFAAETPVIVYAQSSLEEIVKTHGGGLIYHTENQLYAVIELLRTNASLRVRLGREGRAAYEAEFAEAPFLQYYLAVVRELLLMKSKRQPIRELSKTVGSPLLAGRPVFFASET